MKNRDALEKAVDLVNASREQGKFVKDASDHILLALLAATLKQAETIESMASTVNSMARDLERVKTLLRERP
jgi:hypothetical protein